MMSSEGELEREPPGGSDDPQPSVVVEANGGGEEVCGGGLVDEEEVRGEGLKGGVVDEVRVCSEEVGSRDLVVETRVSEELCEASPGKDDSVVCVESERVETENDRDLLEEVRVLKELEWEPGKDESADVPLESEREREENVGISSEDVRLSEELMVKSGKDESAVVSLEFEGGGQEDVPDSSQNVSAPEVKVEGMFRGDIADFENSLPEEVGVLEVKAEGAVRSDGLAASESELGQMTRMPMQKEVGVPEVKVEGSVKNDGLAASESESGQMMRMPAQEEVGVSEVKTEGAVRSDGLAAFEIELGQMTRMPDTETGVSSDNMVVESSISDFGMAYSSAEDGTISRISEAAFGSQAAMVLSYGFEAGDMVWGKVKSHPWWPGHIFCEAFASPSVRRSKREGHVLVAFFGDSSYGWFDLAELIPFEPHYTEKSRQTNSRNFMRAVEEAVDESCRRQALGLTCRCRNRYNFRPTNVPGYFSVDVPGYEQGAVYSVQQIKKARDKFQPTKVLSFVQQLATMPRNLEQKGIDWINFRATVLAFRKASFEEFDETYAQAFGVQPARPSPESMNGSDQGARVPSRAPLSGPLVVAESLGERKGSGRLTKIKEQSRKDKYLFKRRDEPAEPRGFHDVPAHTNLAVSSAYREGPAVTTSSDYVFQKRTQDVPAKPDYASKQEGPGNDGAGGAALIGDTRWQESDPVGSSLAATEFSLADISLIDPPSEVGVSYPANEPVANARSSSSLEDGRLYADTGSSMYEMDGRNKSDVTATVIATGQDKSMTLGPHGFMNYSDHSLVEDISAPVNLKLKESVNSYSNFEVHDQYKQASSLPSENQSGPYQVSDGGHFRTAVETVGALPSHASNKLPASVSGINTDTMVKKKKVLKRPVEDIGSDKSNMGTVKKKKRKELGIESSSESAQRRHKMLKDGELPRKPAGKSLGIGSIPREKPQADQQSRENGASCNFLFDSAVQSQPKVDLENIVVEFPQLLDDLMALALDPFYGAERNSPAIVRYVLLRFRSLVYQKSLVLAPPSEAETSDLSAHKCAVTESADILPVEDMKALPSKRPKHFKRPDDPTVAGRKRNLSDRQEEMSVKRLKKLNDLKALTTEKKSNNQKMQEMQREQKDAVDQKDASSTAAGKLAKPNLVKKQDLPAKLLEPAMLVMKFPPRTTLPSINELKAKFGRFGPLDHSAMRVFWKSSQCRVVFRHKDHAQAALNYAIQNRALFGHVKVSYHLRDVEAPAQEAPEPSKADEVVPVGDAVGAAVRRPPQPTIQLKSCLKKPSSGGADELGGAPRESPRVKFMLGGEESSRAEQSMAMGSSSSSRDFNKNDGGGTSSLAMDVNSKNFQKLVPSVPLLQPNIVGPPRASSSSSSSSLSSRIPEMHETQQIRGLGHFAKPPPFSEVEPINNNFNYKNTNTTSSNNRNHQTNAMDISHQMLSLLVRCNDIVMDVKSNLGYVPYHPL